MKTKLEIYALSVCFAAVVGLAISLAVAGYSVFEIVAPEVTMRSYDYDNCQTNETYWKSIRLKDEARPSEEELTKKRQEAFAVAVKSEQREGVQSLMRCLMFILAFGIVLFVHWKIAVRARAA